MRKHEYIKENCGCAKRATAYVCRFCGSRIHRSEREVRALSKLEAWCEHPDAPLASAQESFKSMLGGTFDCLAPNQGKS